MFTWTCVNVLDMQENNNYENINHLKIPTDKGANSCTIKGEIIQNRAYLGMSIKTAVCATE